MSETAIAVCLSFAFTFVLVAFELPLRSKARPRACLGLLPLAYFLLLFIGNGVSTLLTLTVLPPLEGELKPWAPVIWAFVGVFAFEFVFSNLKLFDQEALDIRKWIKQARGAAVSAAIAQQVQLEALRLQRFAQSLRGLDEERLNTLLVQYEVPEVVPTPGAKLDVQLLKAYRLVYALPDHGESILRATPHRRLRARWIAGGLALVLAAAVSWGIARQMRKAASPESDASGTESSIPSAAELGARPVNALFANQPASEAIAALARQIGATPVIRLAPGNDRTLSLEQLGTPFSEIMNDICIICSCTWEIVPGNPPHLMVDPKPLPAPDPGREPTTP